MDGEHKDDPEIHNWDEWQGKNSEDAGDEEPRSIKDFVRRAVMTGIGAAFVTEEAARSVIGDIKLPKEAMSYIAGQADRTKRDIVQTLARELRLFLDGLEVDELITKTLSGASFEINTTIRVIPNGQGGLSVEKVDAGGDSDTSQSEDKSPKKTDNKDRSESASEEKRAKRKRRTSRKKKSTSTEGDATE